jgi:threonyl-tRNA synthetase
MGNLERFFSVLIEHYAGAFPVWLSPKQVALIPIADRHIDYVKAVAGQLRKAGLRVMVDDRSERMNAKIRDAQNQKIPYMLVIGDKEIENDQVALRLRSGENPGPIPVSAFIDRTKDDISRKI